MIDLPRGRFSVVLLLLLLTSTLVHSSSVVRVLLKNDAERKTAEVAATESNIVIAFNVSATSSPVFASSVSTAFSETTILDSLENDASTVAQSTSQVKGKLVLATSQRTASSQNDVALTTICSFYPSSKQQADDIINLFTKMSWKAMHLLSTSNNRRYVDLASHLEQSAGTSVKIVSNSIALAGQASYASTLKSISAKTSESTIIVLLCNSTDAKTILKEAPASFIFVGIDDWYNTSLSSDFSGAFLGVLPFTIDSTKSNAVLTKTAQSSMTTSNALVYDAIKTFSVAHAGLSGTATAANLFAAMKSTTHTGLTGSISFDANCQRSTTAVYQVHTSSYSGTLTLDDTSTVVFGPTTLSPGLGWAEIVIIVAAGLGIIGGSLYVIRFKSFVAPSSEPWNIDYSEIRKVKLIGKGKYGKVYKALWREKEVAVKLLNIQQVSLKGGLKTETLKEFTSEVKVMVDLRHPNVLLFIGACTKQPNLCIVMQYMSHGSLWECLHSAKPDNYFEDWNKRIKVAIDIALGMNYLHSFRTKIIHRDLKSPNVLMDDNFRAVVSDFGLSTIKQDLSDPMAIGNPLWTAPEVYLSQPLNEKMDVFSFAIVLWEIITLEIPYHGFPVQGLPVQVTAKGLRPHLGEGVPEKIVTLLKQCWAHEPEKRPVFKDILKDLRSSRIDKDSIELGLMDEASSTYRPKAFSGSTDPETKHKYKENFGNEENKELDLVWDLNIADDIIWGKKLGEGMSAEVFKGTCRGKEVAIKKIFFSADDDDAIVDFHKESALMRKLKHENIMHMLGSTVVKPFAYIVCEYMHNGSIYDMYTGKYRKNPPPFDVRVEFGVHIAQGLAYMHSQKVMHRDLKSPNVMVDKNMQAKIGDFGLSRIQDNTKTMTICGSPLWTSPEMLQSMVYNEKVDVYRYV
eukprot:g2068.t1